MASFPATLATPETLLSFDYGTVRIGIAIGQTITATAKPLTTIACRNKKPDWSAIGKLIADWQPQRLVVGLPLQLDGSEQEMTERARRFGNQLKGRYNLPVEMVDERLTSREAEANLAAAGGKIDKARIDAQAAALILQSWLDQRTT
ncbi:MAG: Holliday junction resolvase RuvX [Proteobacteria bacterium]|nr:Holliday junction resolvase RuvX [Pseudomonadota bacterium]